MTKEVALISLEALHDAAKKAHDDLPFIEPLEMAMKREPVVKRAVLYGRFIALGTAIQYVRQIE